MLAPIQADVDGDMLLLESDTPEPHRALTTRVGVVVGSIPLMSHALALPNLIANTQLMWHCERTAGRSDVGTLVLIRLHVNSHRKYTMILWLVAEFTR